MLNSKQRAKLKSIASAENAIFQIGKGGVGEAAVKSIYDALEARELIKIRTLDNSDVSPREAAEQISAVLGAEVVCVIGSKIVLYRESRKHKKLSLEIKAL
mgnify:CR=1 FL=1